jgi:hypothetical protein
MTERPIPTPSLEADRTGKTFADVFYSILTDWRKFFSFLGLVFSLAIFIFLASSLIIKRFKVESVSEVDLSSGKILFQTTFGDRKEYVTIVHPQGWQDTDIRVRKGDHIKIAAGGKITVDLAGITETVGKRKELEKKYEKDKHLVRDSEDPKNVPENYYSDEEKESLKFNRGWIGPNGYAARFTNQSFRARARLKILPEENLGKLLGAVHTGSEDPDKTQVFPIGAGLSDLIAPADGDLWFAINDNIYDDSAIRDLFFGDNIGFFWVKIEKTHSVP